MGIPKFYRWLSERYPAINQRIYDQTFLPGVDNLYLDMNGILHNCSHANGSGIGAKSDKDVLQAVFFCRPLKIQSQMCWEDWCAKLEIPLRI